MTGYTGKALVSSKKPRAFAICDRCGFLVNHFRLQWQMDYAGAGLINRRLLVCNTCNDRPQHQKRAFIVPLDPPPVKQPRMQDYQSASSMDRVTDVIPTIHFKTGLKLYAPDNRMLAAAGVTTTDSRTTQLIGNTGKSIDSQPGTNINALMRLMNQTKYGLNVPVLSVVTDGVSVLTLTCSAAHGLTTNDIIAVEGGGSNLMDGFYSVTVSSPMVFTYQPTTPVPVPGFNSPALMQSSTLIKTAFVGLPRGMTQLPQIGALV